MNIEEINGNKKSFECEGIKMYESDIETLRDGEWLTDSILAFAFKEMDELYNNNKYKNMVFVKPEISQLIKASKDDEEVEKTIRQLGLRKTDWVFYPVNNNETDKEGGSHWSLLLYCGSRNTFYHFDPIKGMNDRSVAMLIKKLIHSEKKQIPEVKYVMCPRQKNNYDCGPYTLMYTEKIVENIEEDMEISKMRDFDASDYRMKLRRKIEKKFNLDVKILNEDEKESDHKKENISNRDGKELNDINRKERKKECWHYTNKTCRFDNNCRYEHKQHCKEMIENGYCYDQACKLGHPRICREIFDTGRCKRYICKHFHPINLRNINLNNQPNSKYDYQEMYERPNNRGYYKPYSNNEVKNTRSKNVYDRWERKGEHGINFLEDRSKDWIDLMGPIMERAMEALEDRMWDRYHRGTKVD